MQFLSNDWVMNLALVLHLIFLAVCWPQSSEKVYRSWIMWSKGLNVSGSSSIKRDSSPKNENPVIMFSASCFKFWKMSVYIFFSKVNGVHCFWPSYSNFHCMDIRVSKWWHNFSVHCSFKYSWPRPDWQNPAGGLRTKSSLSSFTVVATPMMSHNNKCCYVFYDDQTMWLGSFSSLSFINADFTLCPKVCRRKLAFSQCVCHSLLLPYMDKLSGMWEDSWHGRHTSELTKTCCCLTVLTEEILN